MTTGAKIRPSTPLGRQLSRRQSESSLMLADEPEPKRELCMPVSLKLLEWQMPDSKFRRTWDIFIFLVIWYNSLVTPVRIFIMKGASTPNFLIFADVIFDFIFLIDTVLHLFRPHTDENTGESVTDLRLIRQSYVGSVTFYINVIACVPILKTPLSPFLSQGAEELLITNFNVLRMIRILHFPSQFRELKNYLAQKGPVNESVFRMWIILFFTFLLMSIFGCVYFGWATSVVEDVCPTPAVFGSTFLSAEMWVASDSVITDVMDPNVCYDKGSGVECDDCPQGLFFTRSIYFLMQTLFTIGYGDSVVPSKSAIEIALACFFMIVGVFGYGLIIANMTSVLANLDVVSMRFRHEMDAISRWMTFRSVPETLRERVNMCFTYLSRTQHGMLDDSLFADLPPRLAQEFADVHMNMLAKVPFFNPQYRSNVFLSRVILSLTRRVYPPGSYILYQGERQRELIIVKSGRADIYIKGTKDAVGSLLPGDFVGDYQLLFGTLNQVGVRSPDFTEALVLTFEALEEVLDHPDHCDIGFRSLGGNFRCSTDQGALDTISHSIEFLKKISKTASNITSTKKSNKLKDMMQKTEVVVKGLRIMPSSRIHVCWDIFCLLAITYYSIACPARLATSIRAKNFQRAYDASYFVDYILDFIFIVDIFMRMMIYAYVSYESGRNEVVVDRERMRRNYLKSHWFKIDLLAALPYDLISYASGYYALFRIPKMIRTVQIPKIITRLQRNLDYCLQITMNESQVSIVIMFLCSVLIVVWSSAGWNAMRLEESAYDSIYWAFTTLTTVGYGDLTPVNYRETLYALFVGAIGATFSAAIIANVTSFFHDVDISEENTDHKLNCIMHFMERQDSSLEYVKNIQDYFEYIEREQEGINEQLLLSKAVPDHIKANILIHITHTMVTNCDYLEDCESGFIRRVMTSMKQCFFGTQYMVLNRFTPADGMYFIKKGIVELLTTEKDESRQKVTKRLEADESFAEGCLLENWKENPFLARTATNCELWFLSRSVFTRLVDDFPQVKESLSHSKSTKQTIRRASVHKLHKAAELARRKATSYIHPDKYFIQFWFGLVLLVTLYFFVTIPFRVVFMENHNISIMWLSMDYLGDTCMVIDLVIRAAFLAYYDDNHLVVKRNMIWANYRRSGTMKWHILAVIPFEFAVFFVPTICPLWKLQIWSLLRLNKLLRAYEIPYLFNRVESSLAKIGVKVPKNALRVGKLLMVVLLTAHVVGCIFFFIANLDQHSASHLNGNQSNWANSEGLLQPSPKCPGDAVDMDTILQQYVASLYWSMATLTTVGYGDITAHENSTPEILFATVILVIGTAIYTLVIALLEDIVSQLDVTSSLFKMKMNNVDSYTLSQGIPDNLKAKITAYYDNLWRAQKGVKGNKLLDFIPQSLRADVTVELLSPLLSKTFFLKDCSTDFVSSILNIISLELLLPEDVLFFAGQECDSLSFLHKGDIDLFTEKKVKFKTVSNCVLGESSFFGFEPHLCTAKSVDMSEVFLLSMDDFLACLHDNHLLQNYANYLQENKDALTTSKASIEKMIQNLSSSKMAKMLSAEVEDSVPRGVIMPDTLFRQLWDVFALFALIAFTITIPHQISFSENGISLPQFVVDVILDAFFILDVYARAMRFAVMKDGAVVTSPNEFRRIYVNTEFRSDLLSVVPLSTVAYILGTRNYVYGVLRFFQLIRAGRFLKYLESVEETLETTMNVILSTAFMRVLQMFFGVILLCHWFACIFHFIGDSSSGAYNWLVADDSMQDNVGARYLRAFYWALYTVSTVGYGSVPVVSILERIFAMFAMIVGAVICDAGITAVLTSVISNKDHQAGTNSRRVQCSRRFMSSNCIDEELQERVLDFYAYADTELQNIDEVEMLRDFSLSLRSEILQHFCFDSLRSSCLLKGFSEGAIISLVNRMEPYMAIPGETISEIGRECTALYVLQRGLMNSTDETGCSVELPFGVLIGHQATKATHEKEGKLAIGVEIEILVARGLKTKYGNPYAVFRCGSKTCRSSIKKGNDWRDNILMKLPDNSDCDKLRIDVKGWRKEPLHTSLGSAEVALVDSSGQVQPLVLKDSYGKKSGVLKVRVRKYKLQEHERVNNTELTVTAQGYCHISNPTKRLRTSPFLSTEGTTIAMLR